MGYYSGGFGWHVPSDGGGGSDLLGRMRFGVDLIGAKNGTNLVFTTPEKFVLGTLRVYFDGVRQRQASDSDYVVSESGGAGSGYDTVTFVVAAPWAEENVLADYIVP